MSRSTIGSRNDNNNQEILGTKKPESESEEEEDVLLEQLHYFERPSEPIIAVDAPSV